MSRALHFGVVPRRGRWRVAQLFRKFDAVLVELQRRRHERAELRRLLKVGPHVIADVGLDYDDALAESRKAVWKA